MVVIALPPVIVFRFKWITSGFLLVCWSACMWCLRFLWPFPRAIKQVLFGHCLSPSYSFWLCWHDYWISGDTKFQMWWLYVLYYEVVKLGIIFHVESFWQIEGLDCSFHNDIDISSRLKEYVKNRKIEIKKTAGLMGLRINKINTKNNALQRFVQEVNIDVHYL